MLGDAIAAFGAINGGAQFLLALLAYCLVHYAVVATTRLYRAVTVCARGWPPPHLDADGDWQPKPDSSDA